MPALIALLGYFFVRLLLALGIGVTTYTVALPVLKDFILSHFNSLPPSVLQMVGVLRLDIAIVMILSAAVVNIGYKTTMSTLANAG